MVWHKLVYWWHIFNLTQLLTFDPNHKHWDFFPFDKNMRKVQTYWLLRNFLIRTRTFTGNVYLLNLFNLYLKIVDKFNVRWPVYIYLWVACYSFFYGKVVSLEPCLGGVLIPGSNIWKLYFSTPFFTSQWQIFNIDYCGNFFCVNF